ncbi:hypothetical protein B0H17DRAFT_1146291 [Mycena rosella]|uniref:Uncharacterized protein n=1 Tax=Mycena rosella TaxID=1033263 RepID=A0AAD7CP82_MYCRO|nr:hypothetical protein B0H17DRAFT_1146291 [Mycena rosella]
MYDSITPREFTWIILHEPDSNRDFEHGRPKDFMWASKKALNERTQALHGRAELHTVGRHTDLRMCVQTRVDTAVARGAYIRGKGRTFTAERDTDERSGVYACTVPSFPPVRLRPLRARARAGGRIPVAGARLRHGAGAVATLFVWDVGRGRGREGEEGAKKRGRGTHGSRGRRGRRRQNENRRGRKEGRVGSERWKGRKGYERGQRGRDQRMRHARAVHTRSTWVAAEHSSRIRGGGGRTRYGTAGRPCGSWAPSWRASTACGSERKRVTVMADGDEDAVGDPAHGPRVSICGRGVYRAALK